MNHRLIIGFLALALSSAAVSAVAQPRLVSERDSLDLGESWEGEELRAVFPVRNAGDAVLRLTGG